MPESSSPRDSKKQRLSSPSKNACIVFEISRGRIRDAFPYEYRIYYVDCDPNSAAAAAAAGDEFTPTKPTLRYESRYPLAFCGLDSTLYMFEGHDIRTRGRETGFAAKLEITPKILSEIEEEDELVRLRRMRYRKYDPAALPTPDGKSILVFSLRIEKSCCDPTFELYDVAGDSYQQLPQLAPSINTSHFLEPDDTCCAHITVYGFVSNSRFMVEAVGETFCLDLNQDMKKWTRLDRWFPKAGNRFVGTDGSFFFTSDCVCDVDLAKKSFPLPISQLPPHEEDDFIQYMSCTALLDDHIDGACNTCVVQAESYPRCARYAFKCDSDREKYARPRHEEDICLLVVDVCSTADIQGYKREVMKKYKSYEKQVLDGDEGGGKGPGLRTTAIKTLKFMISVDFVSFHSMDLFSI